MKDFLLNENFSMMGIPSDHLIPLDSTGVSTMSRTIQMVFNVQNRAFDLGYLNYEVDKSVRNSVVHCYYLSIDTRLSQFIEFLVSISPEQERQSKINNIRQVILKVTLARKGQTFYNVIIKGETTGVMTFKPSEFKNCEDESNFSDVEHLINLIINEREEPLPTYNQLSFHLHDPAKSIRQLTNFTVQYSDYNYFRNRSNHIYDLVVDPKSLELLEFLKNHYPHSNTLSSEIDQMYVRVSEKKKIASLIIYPVDNSEYEQIDFVPGLLEDSDSKNSLPKFSTPRDKVVSKNPSMTEKIATTSGIKQQIISVCKEIADSRVHTTQKIDELRDLLTSLSVLDEKKPKVKEVIHRVLKREIGTSDYIHVGTKNDKDEVTFHLPIRSEEGCREFKRAWKVYYSPFMYQTIEVFDDGTTNLLTVQPEQFIPSNKIQEIDSSDRRGVIGYVEQAGGLVEVIYYDRFIK